MNNGYYVVTGERQKIHYRGNRYIRQRQEEMQRKMRWKKKRGDWKKKKIEDGRIKL
jgi:hypothetical protein